MASGKAAAHNLPVFSRMEQNGIDMSPDNLPNDRFMRRLKELTPSLLRPDREVYVARAPGRLDVMGGIADYSGGLVLEMPLGVVACAGVQFRDDASFVAHSFQAAEHGWQTPVAVQISDFCAGGRLKTYRQVARLFEGPRRWAAYVLGVFFTLLKERVVSQWPRGATVVVDSDVAMGAGIASSGALEVAAMHATAAAYGLELEPLHLALLCQITENRVAGAPCGVMDQVTAAIGRERHLLELLCQPHQVQGHHALPDGIVAVGLDSGVKHAVGGVRYRRARVGAFMALKIITTIAGAGACGGYLCNITPAEFRRRWWTILPAKMKGHDFLRQYGETDDTATRVDPSETYSVRASAMYPIYENARVRHF
ncbi:MAG: hypothetical protein H5T86_08850, partial [Armatimonadetes bacterium]|nr:hypothetical protein [Armatimonadota bacterium]